MAPILHEAKKGAYTGLWAGFSPEVKKGDGQKYIIPWGRWHKYPRKDIADSLKTKEEGGSGIAAQFWDYCEERTKEFAA